MTTLLLLVVAIVVIVLAVRLRQRRQRRRAKIVKLVAFVVLATACFYIVKYSPLVPNMSAPFAASSGPSNRQDGVRSRSP